MKRPISLSSQRGMLLIEALVAIVITAFGLLGFVALQARATSAEFESYQRSQAMLLVTDMVNRIDANRQSAALYAGAALHGAGAAVDCSAAVTTDALDLCEWGNLIRGTTETRAGVSVGSMLGARGCITQAAGTTDRYIVSVAWQGIIPSGSPTGRCGAGDAAFPDDTRRRVVSSTVCIARLRDPVNNPPVPRC